MLYAYFPEPERYFYKSFENVMNKRLSRVLKPGVSGWLSGLGVLILAQVLES